MVQSMINSAVRKLAYGEYVFFRLWSKALIGKKKRNELVSSGSLNFDRIMFKHFMSRSAGFIKPINNSMGFIFYDKFRCIIPLDDTGVSSEVRRAYLKPKMGDVVIDVGAHYGFYSLHASELVGTEGVVLSFEPHPNNYKGLLANLRLNNIKNVRAFNTALGDFDGQTKLYIRSHSGGHSMFFRSKESIIVRLARLDTIVERLNLKKVNLIKIDTEGAELSILKGACKVIEKFKPNLTIAAYHFSDQTAEIEEWLKRYPFYTVKKARNNFLHAYDRARMTRDSAIKD